jgi:hypothetical protein
MQALIFCLRTRLWFEPPKSFQIAFGQKRVIPYFCTPNRNVERG